MRYKTRSLETFSNHNNVVSFLFQRQIHIWQLGTDQFQSSPGEAPWSDFKPDYSKRRIWLNHSQTRGYRYIGYRSVEVLLYPLYRLYPPVPASGLCTLANAFPRGGVNFSYALRYKAFKNSLGQFNKVYICMALIEDNKPAFKESFTLLDNLAHTRILA